MGALQFGRRVLWKHPLLVGALLLAGLTLYGLWGTLFPKRYSFSITPGSPKTRRTKVAYSLAEHLKSSHVRLKVLATVGSEEALGKVNSRELDLALVQGGLSAQGLENVRQVAALYTEPLHLLVKKEMEADVSRDLAALKGKRINLSQPNSGTYLLSRAVLDFAGLKAPEGGHPGDYLPSTLGKSDLALLGQKLSSAPACQRLELRKQLPDAVFLVESMPSDVAGVLIRAADYRLVPMPFAEAFSLAELNDTSITAAQLEPGFIKSTYIPPYLYQVTPAVPERDCPTLGTSLLLVAHKDIPAAAVSELLKTIYESHFALLTHPQSLSGASPELPLHPGAVAYRDRDQPVVSRALLDVLAKLITLWVFASATCFALSRYFLRDPTCRFAYYLRELTQLDLVARGITEDPEAPRQAHQRVAYLEDKLSRLKAQMIQEIADTKLYREGAMGTVMSLISDTRASLIAQRAKLEGTDQRSTCHALVLPQEPRPNEQRSWPADEVQEVKETSTTLRIKTSYTILNRANSSPGA
jgi:TRAP-type uncharacterized transport system substrate-binding protein